MKMHLGKKIFYVGAIFIAVFVSKESRAQGIISVNQYTGSAQATIPLWTVKSGQLKVPIALAYSTNGIPIERSTGQAGIGWYISSGGQISRQVNDLPDDFKNEYTGTTSRYGWLHGAAVKVNAFVASHGSALDCDQSTYADLAEFGGHNGVDDMYDLEPDVFKISIPGHLSVSFTFDEAGEAHLVDNQQLGISYSQDTDELITEFKVTTVDGTTYLFKKHSEVFTSIPDNPGAADIKDYKRAYYAHQRGQHYAVSWSLRKITTKVGDEIDFLYGYGHNVYFDDGTSEGTSSRVTDKQDTYYYDESSDTYTNDHQFNIYRSYIYTGHLSGIDTKWERVTIGQNGVLLPKGDYKLKFPVVTDFQVLDKRTNDTHLSYEFHYNTVKNNELSTDSTSFYSHLYLSGLSFFNSGSRGKYGFYYHGVNGNTGEFTNRDSPETDPYGFYSPRSVDKPLRKHHLFPDELGLEKLGFRPVVGYSGDHGSTDGFDSERQSIARVALGALKEVRLPLGGREEITYELNRYYDSFSNQDEYGGGIRVKKVRVHDGVSYDNDIVVNYSYTGDNNFSSGFLMYKPTYHRLNSYQYQSTSSFIYYPDFSSGLTQSDKLKRQLILSQRDLSENDHPGYTVAYSKCTVSKSGFGSTATYFDVKNILTDVYGMLEGGMKFSPNVVNSQSCFTGISVDDYSPFNHSISYRFNGKPTEVIQRDGNGNMVSKVRHEYDIIGSTKPVFGIKSRPLKLKTSLAGIVNGFRYGHYKIDHGINEVMTKSTRQSFDPSDDTQYSQVVMEYNYDQLGRVVSSKTTDQESRVYRTYFRYPDQYAITLQFSDRSPEVQAISQLVEKNQIYQPIETYKTLEIGGEEYTIDASLSAWEYQSDIDVTYPKSSFRLDIGDPVADFSTSTITETSIASLAKDSRYKKLSTVLSRNQFGGVVSMEGRGNTKSYVTYSSDGKYPSGVFSGATDEEVVFVDSESESTDATLYPPLIGNIPSVQGRIFGFGKTLSTAKQVYSFASMENNYFLSFWVKSSNAETITIEIIKDGNPVSTESISVAGDNQWNYYETPIVASTGDQLLEIISTGDVEIDELALFPYDASFSYTHFGTNGRKLAETAGGVTNYYEYDGSGRLKIVRDAESNIIQSNEYHSISDVLTSVEGFTNIGYTGPVKAGVETPLYIFTEANCTSFKWKIISEAELSNPNALTDFSDPTATTVSNEYNHTFSSAGRYVIVVKMTCGGQEVVKDKLVDVEPEPIEIDMCFDRVIAIDRCAPDADSFISSCGTTRTDDVVKFRLSIAADPSAQYTVEWFKGSSSNSTSTGVMMSANQFSVGSGPSLDALNYYDWYYYYKIEQVIGQDSNGDDIIRKYIGPKIFFDAYYSASCQN